MAIITRYAAEQFQQLADNVRLAVQNGEIVAIPTETYYGLGVDPFSELAVDRLIRLKEREKDKPILVLIGERVQLSLLTAEISPIADVLIEAFWPGPLTILFRAHRSLPAPLQNESGTIGIRLSSCVPLCALLKSVGPLTGTSANLSGDPPACSAHEVDRSLGHAVKLIVDAGPTPGGPPSTVLDPREPVRIIREGAIPRQMIQNVLQTQGIRVV
jgi:L-threonylcarbamoyladenylate synthase